MCKTGGKGSLIIASAWVKRTGNETPARLSNFPVHAPAATSTVAAEKRSPAVTTSVSRSPFCSKPITGAFALGRRPTLVEASSHDAAQAGPVCSIADDLTVTLVPGRAPLELHDLLHAVAKLLEAPPERFVYRVTADRVFRWAESLPFRDSRTADGVEADRRSQNAQHPDTGEAAIEALIASLNKHCRTMDAQANASTLWQDTLSLLVLVTMISG